MTVAQHENTRHAELLDRIYGFQRHIYDLSRKYYLFGRDRLLNLMTPEDNQRILEIGCGTGRNLIQLVKRNPRLRLFGIDASSAMLATAQRSVDKRAPRAPIQLSFGLAESFDPTTCFSGVERFDKIFFSYSLSMIPDWRGALEQALALVEDDGDIWIVDFWDQAGYPGWFQAVLKWWLAQFHVRFEPGLLHYLSALKNSGRISLEITPVGARYAYLAKIQKSQSAAA